MTTFLSIADYLLEAKIGDKVVLKENSGRDAFIKPAYKMSVFRVVDIFRGSITVKMYGSRHRQIVQEDQPIRRLTDVEFKKLK